MKRNKTSHTRDIARRLSPTQSHGTSEAAERFSSTVQTRQLVGNVNITSDRSAPPVFSPQPLLYSARQAAKMLSISERTLYNLEKSGRLRPIRIGTAKRYDLPMLQAYIESLRLPGDGEHVPIQMSRPGRTEPT
jgi:excisionase family DNA binding protein